MITGMNKVHLRVLHHPIKNNTPTTIAGPAMINEYDNLYHSNVEYK